MIFIFRLTGIGCGPFGRVRHRASGAYLLNAFARDGFIIPGNALILSSEIPVALSSLLLTDSTALNQQIIFYRLRFLTALVPDDSNAADLSTFGLRRNQTDRFSAVTFNSFQQS